MRKYFIGILIGASLMFSVQSFAAVGDKVEAVFASFNLVINGQVREMQESPLVINGVSYLPLRSVSNLLGYDVTYKADSRTIELNNGSKDVTDNVYGKKTVTDSVYAVPVQTPSPIVQPTPIVTPVSTPNLTPTPTPSLTTLTTTDSFTYNGEVYLTLPYGGRKYNIFNKIHYSSKYKNITFDGSDVIANYSDQFIPDCDAFNKDNATYVKESILQQVASSNK